MSLISFVPNAGFMLMDRHYRVLGVQRSTRADGEEHTELELLDSDGIKSIKSLDYLLDQYQKKNIRPPCHELLSPAELLLSRPKIYPLASDVPPDKLDIGKKVEKLLRAVHRAGGLERGSKKFWENEYEALCKEHGFEKAPSKSTVRRWVGKIVKADGIPWCVVLAPETHLRGGKGGIRACDTAVALMHQCVEDFYFGVRNPTISSCHRDMKAEFTRYNLHRPPEERLIVPGYKQLATYIRSLPGYEVEAAKFGRTAASEKFVSVRYLRRKLRPLQRVQVDHTPLDILALDDDGVLLGHVRLTLVIDCCTQAILGYSIGFGAPSAAAVLEALRHACTPKAYITELYPDVVNPWPMHGRFELLAMDNGPEFHSDTRFKASIVEFSIANDFAWMPRGKSRYKGLVEEVQKFLNRSAIDPQPGATGSHPHTRKPSEVPPEQCAVHKLASLHRLLHIWICDVYHVSPHGKNSLVPLKRWKELTALMPVRLPAHFDRLEMACGEIVPRHIQHYGLDICDLNTFNNEELQRVRRTYQHSDTVEVRVLYKPSLLDRIWFKHPGTNEWIPVDNHDPETRGKSQYQIQLMRKLQRASAKAGGVELSIAEAFEKMRRIGNELLQAHTIAQRKRGLRLLGLLPEMSADMKAADEVSRPRTPSRARRSTAKRNTSAKPRELPAPPVPRLPPDSARVDSAPSKEHGPMPPRPLPEPLRIIGR